MARGEAVVERGCQVPECDFGRTVKSESSDTLYEATNREKLKQKEPDRFQNLNRDSEEMCSDIAGRSGLGLSSRAAAENSDRKNFEF